MSDLKMWEDKKEKQYKKIEQIYATKLMWKWGVMEFKIRMKNSE